MVAGLMHHIWGVVSLVAGGGGVYGGDGVAPDLTLDSSKVVAVGDFLHCRRWG